MLLNKGIPMTSQEVPGRACAMAPIRSSSAKLAQALLRRWSLGLGILVLSAAAMAQQKAGEIAYLQGMATAQRPGSPVRFLGRGDQVTAGDVISTTDKGYAVVSLEDGTKFTLRPLTTFALDSFEHDRGTESMAMRLLKGGMRVVSGLVGKRNPGGMELRVSTATVGIRGTSFDARICGDDCRQEGVAPVSPAADSPTAPALGPVVARIVQSTGDVSAIQPGKAARPLGVGAALYQGDAIRSGPAGVAVIGFRDQSKVSVNPQTTLRIDSFTYNRPESNDAMVLSLLKGGLRAFTGLIGKKSPGSFAVQTRTSTIGIRGTGMDISCEGPCVDESLGEPAATVLPDENNPRQSDGLFMFTWLGETYFLIGPLDVPLNRAGYIGRTGAGRLLGSIPEFFNNFGSPRPDQVDVDWDNLFATVPPSGTDGVYILVRDGHVFLSSGNARTDLGIGEAGFAGLPGFTQRIMPPGFLIRDPFPIPENFVQSNGQVFQMFGVKLGQPGQEICRL